MLPPQPTHTESPERPRGAGTAVLPFHRGEDQGYKTDCPDQRQGWRSGAGVEPGVSDPRAIPGSSYSPKTSFPARHMEPRVVFLHPDGARQGAPGPSPWMPESRSWRHLALCSAEEVAGLPWEGRWAGGLLPEDHLPGMQGVLVGEGSKPGQNSLDCRLHVQSLAHSRCPMRNEKGGITIQVPQGLSQAVQDVKIICNLWHACKLELLSSQRNIISKNILKHRKMFIP